MYKKIVTVIFVASVSMGLLTATGCKKKKDDPPPTTTGTTTTTALPQANVDNGTANNILNAVIDIYNQNVAGRSQGAYNNVTVTCPNGGNVFIQGSATKDASSGLTTTDLTYTMDACKEIQTNHTFVYTGIVTEKGSFNSTTNFVSETIKSSTTVAMSGTVTYTGYTAATVNQTVPFTINRGYNTANGDIAGRTFSY